MNDESAFVVVAAAAGASAAPAPSVETTMRRAARTDGSHRWTQLGQLTASVAHDFGNLLTGIIAAAEELDALLQSGAARRDAGQMAENIGAIKASAGRGSALVKQLLRFAARQDAASGSVAVDAAIQDITALLEGMWRSRVRIELDLAVGNACVGIDPTGFDQIVLNLALNARDAMLDGGRLTLRSRSCDLSEPLTGASGMIPAGPYVVVEAADTGIGIAPDVLVRIFDPFFTTKRARGGNGLGLATVHGIVRGAGGLISVTSEVGTGTCFRVYLPRSSASPTMRKPDVAAADAADSAPAGRVVLLVEDEAVVRRGAERVLSRRGWTVMAAGSGEAALALLDDPACRPAVLVTDLDLPGIEGFAVIDAVRERCGRPDLPAILVSGYAPGLEKPGIRFLAKPYTPDELTSEVAAAAGDRTGRLPPERI
ncbi:MAG TPA: ATP-binding protein [Acetobacteraceae bacterium]|jgi:two-component system cell cycle sensor histidine kinase/response regulator CckA|nr:ATP-binding protein [Acetobacteraceae bacterium]